MKLGSDVLFSSKLDLLRNKRVGVVTNHSAVMSDGKHLVDALASRTDFVLTALFGPEHGIRGRAPDRKGIGDTVDEATGVPIFSLFGKTTKPTSSMLKNVDVLLFDIQDVGARFYTYTTTLALTMEAAASAGKKYIVLDRPNPIGGLLVEGPVLEPDYRSFVGWLPFPVVHGLTIGEIALMIQGEQWLRTRKSLDLTVIGMRGWKRSMMFDDTRLAWINPSPSIRSLSTAVVYPGTCFIEGTNVSEGRGTGRPFENLGAPWVNGKRLASWLNERKLPGVEFEAVTFTPHSTRTVTTDSKYEGEPCGGVLLHITNREVFQPVRCGVTVLTALRHLYPERFKMRSRRIDELFGTSSVRKAILKRQGEAEIFGNWLHGEAEFSAKRRDYFLYR